MPVVFGPYLEKLRSRSGDIDSGTILPETGSVDGPRHPIGRRAVVGLVFTGTVGALLLYLRRRRGGPNDAATSTADEPPADETAPGEP